MQARTWAPGRLIDKFASLGLSCGLALAALLLLGQWVGAASAAARPAEPFKPALILVVTTTVDSGDKNLGDGVCGDFVDGGCSLRAAVQELNNQTGAVIQVPAGTFVLTDSVHGDLQIHKTTIFFGAGSGATIIEGNPIGWADRILRVQSGANVLLSGMTISGGRPLNQVGGGLAVVSGTVQMSDVVVENNQATLGGGIYNSGILQISHSTIRGNHAFTEGGGIYNAPLVAAGGYLTMDNSLIYTNTGTFQGGGADNAGAMWVRTSTIQDNRAGSGAGFNNVLTGTLSISNTAILFNYADDGYGAGLQNRNASALTVMVNSTVAGNQGIYFGAGVADVFGTVRLSNVTVAGNTMFGNGAGGGIYAATGQTFTLADSLVALNVDHTGAAPDCAGTFESSGYNLVQNMLGCLLIGNPTGNVTGHDPRLRPLSDYGGQSLTYALNFDSPAVDAGNPLGCHDSLAVLTTDQRGLPRSADGNADGVARCDIGAYELQLARTLLPLIVR